MLYQVVMTHTWNSPSLCNWTFMYCFINHSPSDTTGTWSKKWHFSKQTEQNYPNYYFVWICRKL